MTTHDVQIVIDYITSIHDDDPGAHSAEDALFVAVLTAIANGTCDDPAGCARLALTSRDLTFSRWYE